MELKQNMFADSSKHNRQVLLSRVLGFAAAVIESSKVNPSYSDCDLKTDTIDKENTNNNEEE